MVGTGGPQGTGSRGDGETVPTLYTFGDSILDCGHYNAKGIHPGGILVANDDRLFPEFRGRDVRSRWPAPLEHRPVDGAVVTGLPPQARGRRV